MADKPSLLHIVAEFLSLMRAETGTSIVEVEVTSGDTRIATGETTESGEDQIKILE